MGSSARRWHWQQLLLQTLPGQNCSSRPCPGSLAAPLGITSGTHPFSGGFLDGLCLVSQYQLSRRSTQPSPRCCWARGVSRLTPRALPSLSGGQPQQLSTSRMPCLLWAKPHNTAQLLLSAPAVPCAADTMLPFIRLIIPQVFRRKVPQIGLFNSGITQNILFLLDSHENPCSLIGL